MNQKPPIVLNRARGLGDIITDTFSIQGANIGTFALVAGPVVLLNILFQLIFYLVMPEFEEFSEPLTDEETRALLNDLLEDLAIVGGILLVYIPVTWVI